MAIDELHEVRIDVYPDPGARDAVRVDVRFLGALKSPRDPITCSSLLVVAIAHLVDQLGQTDPGGDAGEADRNNRPIHACI